ncbi:MAG: hypothetical protein RL346_1007 [Verrucomicrobiota bacterium]|jgi:hypothetical protein
MRLPNIVTKYLFGALCIPFLFGVARANPNENIFYIAPNGTRSQITTEEQTNDFLKENVPDGIKDGRIIWDRFEPPSKLYADQKSIELAGGLIITSTRYMKNCIRIITVSEKATPDKHRVIFYQDSGWSGAHIEPDKSTAGVKMAIDEDSKSYIVISTTEGKLTITLPKAQQVMRGNRR